MRRGEEACVGVLVPCRRSTYSTYSSSLLAKRGFSSQTEITTISVPYRCGGLARSVEEGIYMARFKMSAAAVCVYGLQEIALDLVI